MNYENNYYLYKKEIWKQLIFKNEKTHYSISNFGNVRNDKTGRILKQFIQNNGYFGFTISINNKPHSLKTARTVAEHFIENLNPEIYTEVNHKNGRRKFDNSVFNLEWVTPRENKDHALETRLYIGHPGESHPHSKYTNDQIHKVCQFLEENELSLDDISIETNVSRETIADIYWGTRWSFISKYYDVKKYDKLPVNSNRKNSEETIHMACKLMEEGYKNKYIREVTGMSKDSVERLRKGRTFKHISCNYKIQ